MHSNFSWFSTYVLLMGLFEKHKYLIANHKSQIFAICDLVLNPFKNPQYFFLSQIPFLSRLARLAPLRFLLKPRFLGHIYFLRISRHVSFDQLPILKQFTLEICVLISLVASALHGNANSCQSEKKLWVLTLFTVDSSDLKIIDSGSRYQHCRIFQLQQYTALVDTSIVDYLVIELALATAA